MLLPVEKTMKILKNAVIAAAALTMVATPIAASAAPVAARASVQLEDGSAQVLGIETWLIALLAGVGFFGGLAFGFGNHNNNPTSV